MKQVVKSEAVKSQTVKSDLDLVTLFLKGDHLSFEELINRYSTKVYNLAFRFTKNREDAEEVLQDVFTTVFRKVEKFQGKSAFSSWIYRVTVNSCFMKLRKRRRSRTVFIEDVNPAIKDAWASEESTTENAIDVTYRNQIKEILERNIKALPDEYRGVFVLRDIDGFTNVEVGKILGLTTPAVKSRLHRARALLKRKLKAYFGQVREAHTSDEVQDFG